LVHPETERASQLPRGGSLDLVEDLRPKDLVGAITGEAGIHSKQIGTIQISERFTIVEVASDVSDLVLRALTAGTIRGKKVSVRLDKGRGHRSG
jgi:ATP-dependent RNA helicase DeaD